MSVPTEHPVRLVFVYIMAAAPGSLQTGPGDGFWTLLGVTVSARPEETPPPPATSTLTSGPRGVTTGQHARP